MADFKFEGDFATLSDSQKKLVKSVLQRQGFKDGTVIVEPVGQKGDNYSANVKRFVINSSKGASFKMIGKVAPVAEMLRQMIKTEILFNNEIIMYEEVIPRFNNLQNSVGAPANERVRFPQCYGVSNAAPNELILLEDLRENKFEMLDRYKPLTNDVIRMVLKDMAIYHSLSYALKAKEPDTFRNIVSKLLYMWEHMDKEPEMKMYMEATENDVKALLESEKYKRAITGSLSETASITKKILKYERGSKYSVIQQGDCWTNNILFRLEDGKVIDSIMIDYQLSKEGSPAADILYFLFNTTDHATRSKHFNEWIDYYHEVLDEALSNHRLNSKLIYPRDQLDADLRRYGKMMLGFSVMLSSMVVRESKDVVDFKVMEGTNKDDWVDTAMTQMRTGALNESTIAALKKRIEGLVDTVLEFGLI